MNGTPHEERVWPAFNTTPSSRISLTDDPAPLINGGAQTDGTTVVFNRRLVPEWGEETLREVFHEPYRIVYEIFEDRVEILTLSHVRQEFPDEPAGSS